MISPSATATNASRTRKQKVEPASGTLWISMESAQCAPPIALARKYGYDGYMEKATVSKLKNNLSAYLRKVRAGHAVVIYDRDVPIARLERIESTGRGADRLALLSAQGVIRPPLRKLLSAKLRSALSTPVAGSAYVLKALQQDRAEDR